MIVGRSEKKCAETARLIQQKTGNLNASFLTAGLLSQDSIRRLAAQFAAQQTRLDVLINNAGGVFFERKQSVDGIEMTFALNYLGGFLLTNLLLDTLKKSAPTRIINVSSKQYNHAHTDAFHIAPGWINTAARTRT